jgi:hypothetical protein
MGGAAVGGGGGSGFGVLAVWLSGHFGLDMSAEVGVFVGGLAVTLGGAVGAFGILGCCQRLLHGPPKP